MSLVVYSVECIRAVLVLMIGKIGDDHCNGRYEDVCSVEKDSPSSIKIARLVVGCVEKHRGSKGKKERIPMNSDPSCTKTCSNTENQTLLHILQMQTGRNRA